MQILTDEQRTKLLSEVRKVWENDMSLEQLQEGLQYLLQICRDEFDYVPLIIGLLKDTQGKKHLRCYEENNEVKIIDNAVDKYNIDSPEMMVQIIDDMFYKLKKLDEK